MAKKINVSLATYNRYENNETEIELKTAMKLADFYKLSIDELLNETPMVSEAKFMYASKWNVPITVALDGTSETLEKWISKLTAINAAL